LNSGVGADPHVLALDGTRLDVYEEGFYRYYDNCAAEPEKRLVANIDVRKSAKDQDYIHTFYVSNGATNEVRTYTFDGPVFEATVDGRKRVEHTEVDPLTGAKLCFVIEGKYNTVGIRAENVQPLMLCGGLMAGRVQMLDNLQSMEKTAKSCAEVIAPYAAAHRAHALVCGSNSPHAVTFSGASAQTHTLEGGAETAETTLLHSEADELTVSAIFDGGRIQKLRATQRGVEAFKAEWTDAAHQGSSTVRVSGCALLGGAGPRSERGACGMAEALVGDVFIRVQPGGVASFTASKALLKSATGLLHGGGDGVSTATSGTTAAEGTFYASLMEPHLIAAASS
jgi:hypothetical protein